MPLQGAYSYSERSRDLTLVVPLKGVSVQSVSIAATASTVKINYSPYLIDIVLFGEIDSLKHKAVVKGSDLHITLYKKEVGLWGALEVDGNKNELKVLKNEAVLQQEELEKKLNENRYEKRLAEEKYSLRKQMALDDAERSKLDNLKQEEKEQAEKEIYETFASIQREKAKHPSKSTPKVVTFDSQMNIPDKNIFDGNIDKMLDNEDVDDDEEAKQNDESGIEWDGWEDDSVAAASHSNTPIKSTSTVNDEDDEEEVKFIPPPRNVVASDDNIFQATTVHNKIDINFTPRFFPTPMRESKQQEEDDWVAKNRRHLKKHGHYKGHKGKDISEEDPTWLKAKGDDFFRSGDVRSALNAYSSALDIEESMVSCYSNRSACYLKLNMYDECRLDCTEGIKYLTAEQGDNVDKNMLVKLLMRRGAAACQLGNFIDSLNDYQEALRNSQSNSSSGSDTIAAGLAEDIQRLELLVNADQLKKEADAAFSESNLSDAIDKYSEAIALIPVHVGCLSNRATCKIALKDYSGCIDDCTVALDLLSGSDIASTGVMNAPSLNMLNSILPAKGSEKRKAWVLKTIVKRGQAHLQLSKYDEAIRDYSTASGLDPTNESLKSDINKLITAREVAKK